MNNPEHYDRLRRLARLAYPHDQAMTLEPVSRIHDPSVIGLALRDQHGCMMIAVLHERAHLGMEGALLSVIGEAAPMAAVLEANDKLATRIAELEAEIKAERNGRRMAECMADTRGVWK